MASKGESTDTSTARQPVVLINENLILISKGAGSFQETFQECDAAILEIATSVIVSNYILTTVHDSWCVCDRCMDYVFYLGLLFFRNPDWLCA